MPWAYFCMTFPIRALTLLFVLIMLTQFVRNSIEGTYTHMSTSLHLIVISDYGTYFRTFTVHAVRTVDALCRFKMILTLFTVVIFQLSVVIFCFQDSLICILYSDYKPLKGKDTFIWYLGSEMVWNPQSAVDTVQPWHWKNRKGSAGYVQDMYSWYCTCYCALFPWTINIWNNA